MSRIADDAVLAKLDEDGDGEIEWEEALPVLAGLGQFSLGKWIFSKCCRSSPNSAGFVPGCIEADFYK